MSDTGATIRTSFAEFARGADALVLNMPLESGAPEPAQALHMVPEDLAVVVAEARLGKIILAHFMKRSLKSLKQNADVVKKATRAPVILAEDGVRIPLY